MKLENCATMTQCYQIEKRFCNYAYKDDVKSLQDDIKGKADKEDINMILE